MDIPEEGARTVTLQDLEDVVDVATVIAGRKLKLKITYQNKWQQYKSLKMLSIECVLYVTVQVPGCHACVATGIAGQKQMNNQTKYERCILNIKDVFYIP